MRGALSMGLLLAAWSASAEPRSTARLIVESNPPGVQLLIQAEHLDESRTATTPTAMMLPPGRYTLQRSYAGGLIDEQIINLTAQAPKTLRFTLTADELRQARWSAEGSARTASRSAQWGPPAPACPDRIAWTQVIQTALAEIDGCAPGFWPVDTFLSLGFKAEVDGRIALVGGDLPRLTPKAARCITQAFAARSLVKPMAACKATRPAFAGVRLKRRSTPDNPAPPPWHLDVSP